MRKFLFTFLITSLVTSYSLASNYKYSLTVKNETENIPLTIISPSSGINQVVNPNSSPVSFNINDDGKSVQVWFTDNLGNKQRACYIGGINTVLDFSTKLKWGWGNQFEVKVFGHINPTGSQMSCTSGLLDRK